MNIFKISTAIAASAFICIQSLPLSAGAAEAPHYIAVAPLSEENGILTLENGEEWYKVDRFEDNGDYIITVNEPDEDQVILTAADDKASGYIWHYYRKTMVSSTSAKSATLTSDPFELVCHNNELYTKSHWWVTGDDVWDYCNGILSYNGNGKMSYLTYNSDSEEPFACTYNIAEAAQVSIYSKGEQLGRCISGQPAAESYVIEGSGYKAPEFSVTISDTDIIVDSIKWFADGEEQPCSELTFTADIFTDQPAGVHRVSCLIEAHDSNDIHYRERSAEAAFVIAKGVIPDSVMTFSDIHEEYGLISRAIENIIQRTDGYIPSLVICSGDLINGSTPDTETAMERYFPQIVPQLGGIDAVYVAGNHDPGEAASIMSAAADLGAEENLPPSGGQIFRGTSDAVSRNGNSSRYARGLTVYGLNYEAAMISEDGKNTYSYEKVLSDLESFLSETAENYRGELVIISAHSGLHVLGLLPESINSRGASVGKWIGENAYNIDYSDELVQLLNSYADDYDMDIMYLFGHDHSRQETELILTDGDTIISPVKYSERSYETLPLSFTYAHSGYLSTAIGCADGQFSFIYRSGESFGFDLIRLENNEVRHTDIPAKNMFSEPPVVINEDTGDISGASDDIAESTTTDAKTVRTSATTSTAVLPATDKTSADSPETGDDFNILPILIPAAVLLLISRKNVHETGKR